MRMVDLVEKKRDGDEPSKEEIEHIITNYTSGKIPDYQVSALLMAIFYQDMTNEGIMNLTLVIVNSGDVIDLSSFEGVKIDRHLTDGTDDIIILVLAPLVASIGVAVAKMSGHGPSYTGGTLNKLEVIPGFQIELSDEEFVRIVNESKVAVTGQSGSLAPADKELYVSHDVAATVDSLPLIASSIMSKKATTGADAVVLDVTTGDGAFMKNIEDARRLAETTTSIGKLANREVVTVISDMSEPLGEAIGSSLETVEAVEILQGGGPENLAEMYYALGSQMIVLAGKTRATDKAGTLLQEVLESGKALAEFKKMTQDQGGDLTVVEHPERTLTACYAMEPPVEQSGVVSKAVTNGLGIAAMMLGVGRKTKEENTDHVVRLKPHKKIGDTVTRSESLLAIYSNDEEIIPITELLYKDIEIGEPTMRPTLIHNIITE